VQNHIKQPLQRIPVHGLHPAEQFIENHPERVNIHERRHRRANHLFGSHIERRPHRLARLRQVQPLGFRNPEIHQFRPAALLKEDVFGLDVAVNNSPLVDKPQRPRHFESNPRPVRRIPGVTVPDGVPQVLSAQKLEHHERVALLLAVVIDGDNVVMLNRPRQPRLVQKTLLGLRVADALLGQDLHRHSPAHHRVYRLVDMRHSSTQKRLQFIATEPHR